MPKGIMLTPEQQAVYREDIVGVALRLIAENGRNHGTGPKNYWGWDIP